MARQTALTCGGHTRPVVDLSFSNVTADGIFLISASKDGKPMLRNGQTGDWIGTFEGHKGAVWGATLDATAERAATAAADYTVKLWDAVAGKELHTFDHPKVAKSADFAHHRTRLATSCNDKNVRIYDLTNYTQAPVILSGHTSEIKKVLWSPDDQTLISGSDDKTLRFWDLRTNTTVQSITVDAPVTSFEVSRDSHTLTVTYGKSVNFFDLSTLQSIKSTSMSCGVFSASLHPDNSVFAWGGEDFSLHVARYSTLEQQEEYKGHFGPVHCVRFSPDGEIYASGSEDGTIRLWQTHVGTEYGLWKFAKADGDTAAVASASE